MTWKFYEIRTGDQKKAQALLDDRFDGAAPSDSLPNLGWVGIWCRQPVGGAYWSPAEAPILDAMEEDLIALAEKFGHGWAVYLRRLATPGVREYYFYFGGDADLRAMTDALKAKHPMYRIEFDSKPDPTWARYASWLAEAPLG